jgi:predicted lysophospholipase L1 biosynthesis ABC-type transport system permease subunit
MGLRERKIFTVFTLIYTALIFLTSLFWEYALTPTNGTTNTFAASFVLIFLITSLVLSILYAWIIVSRNRRTWATLKCIGYTNRDINKLVSGIILFTTLVGFAVVIEALFHYAAIMSYFQLVNLGIEKVTLVGLLPVIITSALFILVQLIAILIANRRILKVRPIIALKKVGE